MEFRTQIARLSRCIAAVSIAFAVPALAAYPERPISFVVPYTPGGATDAVARTVGAKIGELLGQTVVVENKPGAGGNIGTNLVAKAAPDGYTMLLATTANAINESLYTKLPFDASKDFTPVTQLVSLPNVLIVNPSVPARDVKELIALAKAKPNALNYASAGSGTSTHLAAELFKSMAKVDIMHIAYKGSSPAMMDLLGGRVQMMFDNMPSALPQLKEGKVRALAVTGPRRSASLPDTPTVAEAAIPGFEAVAWHGIFFPAGTPPEVVQKVHAAAVKALSMPEVKERLRMIGAEPAGTTPEEFAQHVKAEIAKWARVVKASGAKID